MSGTDVRPEVEPVLMGRGTPYGGEENLVWIDDGALSGDTRTRRKILRRFRRAG